MSSGSVLGEGDPSRGPDGLSYELERVAFPSCGVTLRGVLLRPRVSEPIAAIASAPGMSGVKEGSIMKFADRFASARIAVLAYDNIKFGESDGEPRQEADPVLQRRGYRDAITYLSLRSDIDKSRIGIFGTSYSGGHVLEVAAHDRRVKCVVTQIPSISGFEAFHPAVRPAHPPAFLEMLDQDWERRFQGGDPVGLKAGPEHRGEPCIKPGRRARTDLH